MTAIDWERVFRVIESNSIAAVLGAVLGVLGTWYYEKKKFRRDTSSLRATIIVERLGLIFSRYTLDALNSSDDLKKMRVEWGSEAERFDYLADRDIGKQLDALVQQYLDGMKAYLDGQRSASEVESLRQINNRQARALVEDFLTKHGATLQKLPR